MRRLMQAGIPRALRTGFIAPELILPLHLRQAFQFLPTPSLQLGHTGLRIFHLLYPF
jgi:ABC-type uncharacterized transport system permease subunit